MFDARTGYKDENGQPIVEVRVGQMRRLHLLMTYSKTVQGGKL